MIILGIILLVAGFLLKVSILWTIGIIVLVIGVILMILGPSGTPSAVVDITTDPGGETTWEFLRYRTGGFRGTGSRAAPNLIRIISIAVLVWLVIGAVAAGQRGYFTNSAQNCASAATIAITVFAGPLNYLGSNPKVTDCAVNVPQPSP